MVVFCALLIFIILLFVHELGHLLAAKACGIPVISFSLGAGKALYRRRIGQTIYIIRLLPVGGSVRTVNFNTSNDKSNKDSSASNDKKGASRKLFPVEEEERELFDLVCAKHRGANRSRHALLLGLTALSGPVCSALFGMAFMFGAIFFIGTATTSKQLIVENITPGSPAAVAGLIAGDLITSVDRKSEDVESIVTVQRPNTKGEATTISLPVTGKVRGTIGWTGKHVTFAAGIVASYPWAYFSTREAFKQTSYYSKVIFNTLIGTLLDMPKIVTTPSKQGGIVAMANVVAPQVSGGMLSFFVLILYISLLIAISSLIPFPGFDGWHALMHLAEAIIKQPAPIFIQQSVARAGLAVMSVLTVYLIGKDVFDYVVVKLF